MPLPQEKVSESELKEWLQLGLATQIADDPQTVKISKQQFSRMKAVLIELVQSYEGRTKADINEEVFVSPPDWLIDEVIETTGFPEPVVVACVDLIPYHIEELLK